MDREQAFEELKLRVKNENIIRHSIAVEAIMRAFGRYFKDDEEKWAITGLLHDIDYERTKDNPEQHGLIAAEILEGIGADEFIIYAIKSHNDLHGILRKRKLDKILYSADPLAGLIIACTLITSSKKLDEVTVEFILKRMDDKGFATGANRNQIRACSEAGIVLEDFVAIGLEAMKSVATDIGL